MTVKLQLLEAARTLPDKFSADNGYMSGEKTVYQIDRNKIRIEIGE